MEKFFTSVSLKVSVRWSLTPDPSRLMPVGDVSRLSEWGAEINHRYGAPLAQTQGLKKSLTLKFDKETTVDACIIQEDIAQGERIRKYVIEANVNGKWQKLGEGESVGHKRIAKFAPVATRVLRLTTPHTVAMPPISNLRSATPSQYP